MWYKLKFSLLFVSISRFRCVTSRLEVECLSCSISVACIRYLSMTHGSMVARTFLSPSRKTVKMFSELYSVPDLNSTVYLIGRRNKLVPAITSVRDLPGSNPSGISTVPMVVVRCVPQFFRARSGMVS